MNHRITSGQPNTHEKKDIIDDAPYVVTARKENQATLQNDQSIVTVIYTNHNTIADLSSVQDSEVDGMVIDMGSHASQANYGGLESSIFLETEHYKEAKKIFENGTPIYITDCLGLDSNVAMITDGIILSTTTAAGALLLNDQRKAMPTQETLLREKYERNVKGNIMSRRQICRGALAAIGGYLIQPAAAFLARRIAYDSPSLGPITEQMAHDSNTMHPEQGNCVTRIRDLAMALKLRCHIAPNTQKIDQKPHFLHILGAQHVEFAQYMQRPLNELLIEFENMSKIFAPLSPQNKTLYCVRKQLPVSGTTSYYNHEFEVEPMKKIVQAALGNINTPIKPTPETDLAYGAEKGGNAL